VHLLYDAKQQTQPIAFNYPEQKKLPGEDELMTTMKYHSEYKEKSVWVVNQGANGTWWTSLSNTVVVGSEDLERGGNVGES